MSKLGVWHQDTLGNDCCANTCAKRDDDHKTSHVPRRPEAGLGKARRIGVVDEVNLSIQRVGKHSLGRESNPV